MNKLYFGDNLNILRDNIKDETVDLIYLDPPFNSKRDYNLLFKTPKGHSAEALVTAFEDSWHWGENNTPPFQGLGILIFSTYPGLRFASPWAMGTSCLRH